MISGFQEVFEVLLREAPIPDSQKSFSNIVWNDRDVTQNSSIIWNQSLQGDKTVKL